MGWIIPIATNSKEYKVITSNCTPVPISAAKKSLLYGLLNTSNAIFLHPYSFIESSEVTFSLVISISLLIERQYIYDKITTNIKMISPLMYILWE